MAPGNVNRAVETQDKTIHPELLELTMEIIENRRKMEEEGNISSAVEHVDVVEKDSSVVEKGSSVAEKDSSVVEDLDVAEKAQDVEIGAGLDDEEMDPVGKKSSVDSGVDSGAEDGQEDVCPPPPDGEFPDAEEMVESIKQFAQDHGYAICIRRSEKDKKKIFKCDRYELLFLFFSYFFFLIFLSFHSISSFFFLNHSITSLIFFLIFLLFFS